MKRSGDQVTGTSGDRKGEFTAEVRSRGESNEFYDSAMNRDLRIACSPAIKTDHPITCARPITRFFSVPAVTRKVMHTLRAALREIFDESAYDRFLWKTSATRSAASYRAFTQERDAAMMKRPRCC
jgi:hypothetical protein